MFTKSVLGVIVIVAFASKGCSPEEPTTRAQTGMTTMPGCDVIDTVIERSATVEVPEHMVGDWVPQEPDILKPMGSPGLLVNHGWKMEQGGRATLNVTFGMDGLYATRFGNPDATWCNDKGNHKFEIKVRAMCNYTSKMSEPKSGYDYFWVHAESQIATECAKQQLGVCRLVRVSKPGSANLTWAESQDGGVTDLSQGPMGTGGSLVEGTDGSSLTVKWDRCPSAMLYEQVVADPLL